VISFFGANLVPICKLSGAGRRVKCLMCFGRRRGREAEGGGLLNRYTVKSRIEGSNPSVSASTYWWSRRCGWF
jgi:hypothetical protein